MATTAFDDCTTSAGLSELEATLAAQASGGQIPPSAPKEKRNWQSSVASAHHFPPSGGLQTTRHLSSPGTRDPFQDDRSGAEPRSVGDAVQVIGQTQCLAKWIFTMLDHQCITAPCNTLVIQTCTHLIENQETSRIQNTDDHRTPSICYLSNPHANTK